MPSLRPIRIHNGVTDLLDYAAAAGTLEARVSPAETTSQLVLRHRRWTDGGLFHAYEASRDLQSWSVVPSVTEGILRHPDYSETVTLRFPQGYPFVRVRIYRLQ